MDGYWEHFDIDDGFEYRPHFVLGCSHTAALTTQQTSRQTRQGPLRPSVVGCIEKDASAPAWQLVGYWHTWCLVETAGTGLFTPDTGNTQFDTDANTVSCSRYWTKNVNITALCTYIKGNSHVTCRRTIASSFALSIIDLTANSTMPAKSEVGYCMCVCRCTWVLLLVNVVFLYLFSASRLSGGRRQRWHSNLLFGDLHWSILPAEVSLLC